MIDAASEYWRECLSQAADDCGLALTNEQLECLAKAAQISHELYGDYHYTPSAGDRLAQVEDEWRAALDRKQNELDRYKGHAEDALKRALRIHSDARVHIDERGDVYRTEGRTERIL